MKSQRFRRGLGDRLQDANAPSASSHVKPPPSEEPGHEVAREDLACACAISEPPRHYDRCAEVVALVAERLADVEAYAD